LVLLFGLAFFARAQAVPLFAGSRTGEAGVLRLDIIPVRERYCEATDELASLRIKSRLRFTNAGPEPIILWKGRGLIQRVMLGRTLEDIGAKRYVQSASITTFTTTLEVKLSLGPSPGSSFVVLAPGESYEVEAEPSILVARHSGSPDWPKPGRYLLQVEVETWPETQELGGILAARWKEWGNLWMRPTVLSTPLPIDVRKNPKVGDCH